jgi:hypothetical protein
MGLRPTQGDENRWFFDGAVTNRGIVKLTTPRRSVPEVRLRFSPSAGTRRRLPVSESAIPKESMVNRFEMMPSYSEQVVNRAVDREKSLNLCR